MIIFWVKILVSIVGLVKPIGMDQHTLSNRFPASEMTELSDTDKQDFYHLSEGSDIFPYDWLVRIKSSYEQERTKTWDKGFFDGIESRVNVIKYPNSNQYLLDYIGLTAAWSGHASDSSDALKSEGAQSQLRWVGSTPSVRMVGINCAFCHVGKVSVGGVSKIIDGSQAMVNVQRLYADMIISTISLLFNGDHQLEKFLLGFNYSPSEAKTLAEDFASETLKETAFSKKMQLLAKKIGLIKNLSPRTFAGEEQNIAHHFERLLKLTHHMKADQDIGVELRKKFEFLASFAGGSPKFTTQGETVEKGAFHKSNDGFTRLEAFVSAGNRIFRDRKDWVSVDGPVGLPSIWGVNKKAVFHYTGNTNTTLMRNVGQALSLGAVILDEENRSAIKIENIGKLEKLSVRMNAPIWEEYFTPEFVKKQEVKFKIDRNLVEKGQKHYQQLCSSCHTPSLVGPNHDLEYYPFIKLSVIGTDPNLAMNAVKPIREGVSYSSMFVKTMDGILSTYEKEHPATRASVEACKELDKRGKEWIRESYNPNADQAQGVSDLFPIVPKGSGYMARNLKGIWATAPYLHNNSVPSLWDLLQPAQRRPQIFERGINNFDPIKVGLAQRFAYTSDSKGIQLKSKDGQMMEKFDCEATSNQQLSSIWEVDVCLDTKLSGNSNSGHKFGVNLLDSEKMELIEYLKTL